jgi:hypothetical protein
VSPEAECALTFLHGSPVGDSRTVTTKVLREIMLETGGDLTHVHEGYVSITEIRRKSLGAGVYKIYLERRRGEK